MEGLIDLTEITDNSMRMLTSTYFNNIVKEIKNSKKIDNIIDIMEYCKGWKTDLMFSCYEAFCDGDDEVLSKKIIGKCKQKLLTINQKDAKPTTNIQYTGKRICGEQPRNVAQTVFQKVLL